MSELSTANGGKSAGGVGRIFPRFRPVGPFSLFALGVLLATCYLAIRGLGNAYFWGDESSVAIAARNLLTTGRLTGWDGRNLLAYADGQVLDQDLRYRDPPLAALTAAAGFRLFGTTTWAGRIPFVAAGLAALAIFAILLREELGERSPAAWYALAAFAFSPVFLLFIRQCRYYALAMLFGLMVFWAWRRALVKKGAGWFILAAAAAAGLFYSNWLLCAAFLPALAAAHLAFFRNRFAAREWKIAALCFGAFLLATVPYAFRMRIWDRPEFVVERPWYVNKPILLWWFLRDLSTMGCVPWMLVAIVIALLVWRRPGRAPAGARSGETPRRDLAVWSFFGIAYVVIIALICPQTTARTFFADVRYLMPVVPILIGSVGMGLGVIHGLGQWGRRAAVLLLCVMLTCNVLYLTPAYARFRWLLPAYLAEIHNPYPTANEAVAQFLLARAKQDDLVRAAPDSCNYPILFYAGDRVKLCCTLTERSHILAQAERLGAPLLEDRFFPDWFIVFGADTSGWRELLKKFSRPVQVENRTIEYRYEGPFEADVYWAETNRPELFVHAFGPLALTDPADGVFVFHKIAALVSGQGE